MFINKEGKLFGKVSIVDILVIIALIVVILGVYTKFFKTNETVSTDMVVIEYQMRVEDVREGTVKALENLGIIKDEKTKEYMGEITDAYREVARREMSEGDGDVIYAVLPDRYNSVITIRVEGKSNNSGYYTKDNKLLSVGSKVDIVTKYAKTSGEIISIKEVK